MSAVPLEHIVAHYQPEKRASELLHMSHLDLLQTKVTQLLHFLSERTNISTKFFGVTGSILLDVHNIGFSDIDLTINGIDPSYIVKKKITGFSTDTLQMQPYHGEQLRKWCLQKTQHHPISLAEAERIYSKKWNVGVFEKVPFSLHPVKLKRELDEGYGDKKYTPDQLVTVTAEVVDSQDSIFLPSVYKIEDVRIKGHSNVHVREVVSYEGLYSSLAEEGEEITAVGKLEHVHDNRNGENFERVVVGSPEGKGREFIVPLR
jgi:predicted nucleotidyltransferase